MQAAPPAADSFHGYLKVEVQYHKSLSVTLDIVIGILKKVCILCLTTIFCREGQYQTTMVWQYTSKTSYKMCFKKKCTNETTHKKYLMAN